MAVRLLNNIIMFLLISSTGGLLFVYNRNLSFLIFAVLLLAGFFYLSRSIKKEMFYSVLLSFISILFLFFLNFIFAPNPQSITKFAFFGVTFFVTSLALLFFYHQDHKAFLNSLYSILKLILFHSLISFFLYPFLKNNLFEIVAVMEGNNSVKHTSQTFYYIFYYLAKGEIGAFNFFGYEFMRNSGVFWEPGILQFYLNILFFIEMTFFKKNKKLLLLIIISIAATYSTTGFLILSIQIIYFLFKHSKKRLAVIFIFMLSFPIYIFVGSNINEKVYGETASSFQKRLLDFTQPVFIALENPITGVGVDLEQFSKYRSEFYPNSDFLNKIYTSIEVGPNYQTSDRGSTNSVTYLLAGLGIPSMIFIILMLTRQQIVEKHRLLFFSIIFITALSEPLLHRPFFFVFIMSGLASTIKNYISVKI